MKHRFACFAVLALALFLVASPVPAATRTVICEAFTEWGCGPCAGWNPTEYQVLTAMTRDTVVAIKYHVSWPQGNDAMYLYNPSEINARVSYYGVNAVPDGFVDGRTEITRSLAGFRNQVRMRRAVAAPCEIEFSATTDGGTTVSFSGTITTTDSALTNTRLYAALIQDRIDYTSPPGANGETMFYDVFRDMWPSTSGQTIASMALDSTMAFSGTLTRQASWPNQGFSVVVWLQDWTSKWTHQAAWAPVLIPYAMRLTTEDPVQAMVDINADQTYSLYCENLGNNDDVYTVALQGVLPAGWTSSVSTPTIPGNPNSIDIPLASQEETWIFITISPNGNPGSMPLTVDVQSQGSQDIHQTRDFRVMAGVDILLVDDDGGETWGNYESYFTAALDQTAGSQIWGWWDMAEPDALDGMDLNGVDIVVWATGSSPLNGTLNALEQSALEVYLESGGNLFMTGQGIAWDLRTSSFLSDYLHAQNPMPYAAGRDVQGITGRPIGDGLVLNIHSSGGAQNQTRQNYITSTDEAVAVPFFYYTGTTNVAGLAVDEESYNVVFLPFGFEAINTETARNDLMSRILNWLMNPDDVNEPVDANVLPTKFDMGQNYPNPFNPETTIPYMLPTRANVSLRVFDMLGREVAQLVNGELPAGTYTAHWNAADLATGLYFYRLDATAGDDQFHATRKLMLLK